MHSPHGNQMFQSNFRHSIECARVGCRLNKYPLHARLTQIKETGLGPPSKLIALPFDFSLDMSLQKTNKTGKSN